MNDPLTIGNYAFQSRLLVGSGRFRNFTEMLAAIEASEAEVVTVALRRVDLDSTENVLHHIDPQRWTLLPNTSGCYSAAEAVRVARLAREALETDLIKLEVIGDTRTLLPDVIGTLEAAETLCKDGFTVLPYTTDDLNVARRLQDVGCAAVMPAAAPIGSGQGLLNPLNLELLIEAIDVPVIVDAGLGLPSHAADVMERGADAVLMNTAIAAAADPVAMACAMRQAVEAGRAAHLAGAMQPQRYASASSPLSGLLDS